MLFLGLFSFKSPTYSILKMTGEALVCWTAGGLLFWWCMTIPWQAAVLSLLQLKDCSKGSSPFVSVKFTDYRHHFCMCAIQWALRIVTVTSLPDSSPWSWLGGFHISSRKLECILFHLYHIQLLNILSVQYFLAYWINASIQYLPEESFPVFAVTALWGDLLKHPLFCSGRTPESHLSLDVPPGYFVWFFFFLLSAWLFSGLFKPVSHLPFAASSAFQPCVLPVWLVDFWAELAVLVILEQVNL